MFNSKCEGSTRAASNSMWWPRSDREPRFNLVPRSRRTTIGHHDGSPHLRSHDGSPYLRSLTFCVVVCILIFCFTTNHLSISSSRAQSPHPISSTVGSHPTHFPSHLSWFRLNNASTTHNILQCIISKGHYILNELLYFARHFAFWFSISLSHKSLISSSSYSISLQ